MNATVKRKVCRAPQREYASKFDKVYTKYENSLNNPNLTKIQSCYSRNSSLLSSK